MKKLVVFALLLAVAAFWFRPEPVVSGGNTVVFPLSIKGKTYQPDVFLGPGVKGPVGKLNDKVIAQVLQGVLPDFAAQYMDLDPSGRFFLFFDGRGSDGTTIFRVATNSSGADSTVMNGLVTSDGFMWAVGEYDLPLLPEQCPINMTGKISFEKGSFTPKKITGTFNLLCFGIGETFTIKFKTLKPVV
jgi:hypothetical protein